MLMSLAIEGTQKFTDDAEGLITPLLCVQEVSEISLAVQEALFMMSTY